MDWIPKNMLKLAALGRVWIGALGSEEARTSFHWDADLCWKTSDKIKFFVDACDACAENDSTYNRDLRRETRTAAVAAMRAFAASSVRNNPYMTESDREKLGLRKPDTVHTPHNRPESRPTAAVERTLNYFEHRVKALNDAGKNSKPADAYGVRFVWQPGGEKPASGAAILKGKFSRKPVMTFTYDETDRGKTAYYACCYENSKGEPGPWSPVVEAFIA